MVLVCVLSISLSLLLLCALFLALQQKENFVEKKTAESVHVMPVLFADGSSQMIPLSEIPNFGLIPTMNSTGLEVGGSLGVPHVPSTGAAGMAAGLPHRGMVPMAM